MRKLKGWGLPVLLAGIGFFLIRPRMAQALTREEIHGLYLSTQNVGVEVSRGEGKTWVEYVFENERVRVSHDGFLAMEPDIEGEYVVWMERVGVNWQIFRYDMITGETIQITGVGNNVNPAVYGERVVWEGFVGGRWQVFMFDGVGVTQLTSGESIENVDLYEDWLSFRQRTIDGTQFEVKMINLLSDETVNLGVGSRPTFEGSDLVWEERSGVEQRVSLGLEIPPLSVDEEIQVASDSAVASGSAAIE